MGRPSPAGSFGQPKRIMRQQHLVELLTNLRAEGYTVIGPTVHGGAVDYGEIVGLADLPTGWIEYSGAGSSRLERSDGQAAFHHTVGQTPWKRFIIPNDLVTWRARETDDGFTLIQDAPAAQKLAFFGIRSCDLHALEVLDRVYSGNPCERSPASPFDPTYRCTREGLLIIAFHCVQPGDTCFCASLGTGPKAVGGFDLALTELTAPEQVTYLVESGSTSGERLLAQIQTEEASPEWVEHADRLLHQAAQALHRSIDIDGLKELLYRSSDAPRWQQTARRCLTCANCTLVCPTCFCSTVVDETDLTGQEALRRRRWDSCFSLDFSYLHGGGSVRVSPASRYRHWLTHKLATWQDQFGVVGCVGCGRCITWCPAGIDITEEVQAIRQSDRLGAPNPEEACDASL